MSPPLDESFFIWLCNQVDDVTSDDPRRTHYKLLKQLYTKEFIWFVANDNNRLEDGKDLRRTFIHETIGDQGMVTVDGEWMRLGCSVLELMVGLSRKLSFEAEGEPYYWFWRLMENIGLHKYSDDRRIPRRRVEDILDRLMFRQYDANGNGGFFPLRGPCDDQRGVELWYQMSAYISELN